MIADRKQQEAPRLASAVRLGQPAEHSRTTAGPAVERQATPAAERSGHSIGHAAAPGRNSGRGNCRPVRPRQLPLADREAAAAATGGSRPVLLATMKPNAGQRDRARSWNEPPACGERPARAPRRSRWPCDQTAATSATSSHAAEGAPAPVLAAGSRASRGPRRSASPASHDQPARCVSDPAVAAVLGRSARRASRARPLVSRYRPTQSRSRSPPPTAYGLRPTTTKVGVGLPQRLARPARQTPAISGTPGR